MCIVWSKDKKEHSFHYGAEFYSNRQEHAVIGSTLPSFVIHLHNMNLQFTIGWTTVHIFKCTVQVQWVYFGSYSVWKRCMRINRSYPQPWGTIGTLFFLRFHMVWWGSEFCGLMSFSSLCSIHTDWTIFTLRNDVKLVIVHGAGAFEKVDKIFYVDTFFQYKRH